MRPGGNTIFITSNEAWSDMWYSKQHYAYELAKLGNEVYFLNPTQKWSIKNVFSYKISVTEVLPNLFVINYRNNLPVFKGLFRVFNDYINSYKLFKALENKNNLIFWLFDPFRFVKIGFFKNYFKIFHAVDDYSNFTIDLKLARSSDLIVVTSPVSLGRYKSIHQRVIHIPHGIGLDDLNTDEKEVETIQNKHGKFMIYIGGINKHLNFPMLNNLAVELNDISILFLGKMEIPENKEDKKMMDDFFSKKNVQYLGIVHAKKLKNFISAATVCLIPYYPYGKSRAQTLKAITYLTQLKPIVSIQLSDLKPFSENYIFMTEDDQEYIDHVKEVIEDTKYIDSSKAKLYRDSILYPTLIKKIFEKVNEQ